GLPANGLIAVDRAIPTGADRGEAVVLGGDLHAARGEVADGVVGAAMPEGELGGLEADGAAEQLVAEADPPHGLAADDLANGRDDVVQRRRIAGPVREEY